MNLLLLLFGGILAKDFCFETENKAKLLDVISFAMKRTKEKNLVIEVMFENEGNLIYTNFDFGRYRGSPL